MIHSWSQSIGFTIAILMFNLGSFELDIEQSLRFPESEEFRLMQGLVDQRCEAIMRVAVSSANSPTQRIETELDRGFAGVLSLPLSIMTALE
jgi:hypothetical protein